MKNLFVLILLAWVAFAHQLSAQQPVNYYDNRQNKVIATTGLNMRSAPSLRSEKVGLVPFGKSVEVIGDEHYGKDTLGTPYKIYHTSADMYQPVVDGYWVK
ncbi:MAG: SH3 domain-containing protein, partial [Bacteroidota bacterium]